VFPSQDCITGLSRRMNLETHATRLCQEQSIQNQLPVGTNVDWLSSLDAIAASDKQGRGDHQHLLDILHGGELVHFASRACDLTYWQAVADKEMMPVND